MHAKRSGTSVFVLLALFGCGPSVPPANGVVPGPVAAAAHAAGPTFHVFTAGSTPGLPARAVPRDVVVAADGTAWFTDAQRPAIGSISTHLKVREFTAGLNAGALPYDIVNGPDGNVWFSDGAGSIGRVTPAGQIAEFRTPHADVADPAALTVGSDGALWTIAVGPPSYLVRATVEGRVSSFRVPRDLIPDGSIEADGSGNLWFFASLTDHEVVLVQSSIHGSFLVHSTGLVTKGEPCCANLSPNHIAIGSDGNPWFTLPYFGLPSEDGQLVGTFAAGQPVFYHVARNVITFPVYPSGIASGVRALWFSGSDPIGTNGAVWRITTAGKQQAYPIPYNPAGFAIAPDQRTLWFTSQVQGRAPQIVEASFEGVHQ
ncbi:MAG TPA: hypothetical protein VMF61_00360 [Candidatus Acidoferrales bacterium]|nr:hypothetical protein [Candidatus Acidoferrales bacterium]